MIIQWRLISKTTRGTGSAVHSRVCVSSALAGDGWPVSFTRVCRRFQRQRGWRGVTREGSRGSTHASSREPRASPERLSTFPERSCSDGGGDVSGGVLRGDRDTPWSFPSSVPEPECTHLSSRPLSASPLPSWPLSLLGLGNNCKSQESSQLYQQLQILFLP